MPINQENFMKMMPAVFDETAKGLSLLLNSKISISFLSWTEPSLMSDEASTIYSCEFKEPSGAKFAAMASKKLTWIMADLMAGGKGAWQEGSELDETKLAAFSEAMKQSLNTASQKLKLEMQADSLAKPNELKDASAFKLKINFEGIGEEEAQFEMNSELAEFLFGKTMTEKDTREHGISAVEFAAANPNSPRAHVSEDRNLNLLMDIRMGLTVELGRSEMPLKDILKLAKGSVIELDRLSGEPVDLFVNNKLIARGEVVVIDDNFGLRITQLAGNLNLAHDMGLMAAAE